ncbi:MAG: hypothetical protein GX797_07245 [Chloroflexi bacterium]|nr:hypothetical protein [Chloroflexota bacterium]
MEKPRPFKIYSAALLTIFCTTTMIGSVGAASQMPADKPQIEIISEYFTSEQIVAADGLELTACLINGPSQPLPEFQAEREGSMITIEPQGTLPNFPSYNWVFGCSAVSAAMITAWYDRGSFPNMYTGPTNGGVMPLTDTVWSPWSDGKNSYPSNPLVASRKGLDGCGTRGSVEDYWVETGHTGKDPYLAGGWNQHAWGSSIGDYMKTSQSAFNNIDGATRFYFFDGNPDKFRCSDMESYGIADQDGTYGRKLFYQARGYLVGDCYNQLTDNRGGGFTLARFKAEIDAGHPVALNLVGHTVVAYGYNGSTIYIRDTWDSNPNNVYSMPWGGSYQGMVMHSVSIVHPFKLAGDKHLYLPLIKN